MGVEILAGRLLAPTFGSSVFTWGAVIGVLLAALSGGYVLGGRYASTHASMRALSIISAMSAVSVAVIAVSGDSAVAALGSVPIPGRYATIVPVAVLFGPMTFLLGIISPFAAEQSTAESHGGASGRVYALGTIGSIVGAFGTTFVLIPSLSVGLVAVVLAVPLVVVAVVLAEPDVPSMAAAGLAVLAVVVAASLVLGAPAGEQTLYETQTAYSQLEVTEENGVRTLYLDGVPQSAVYTDDREGYVFDYAPYMHIPMLMDDDVERVLFVGGGGFTGPQRYAEEYPNVTVDAVELDRGVVTAAEQYFRLEESDRLRVHVGDGRRFLSSTDHTYDVIVLDAFRADQVPFHLTTREFLELTNSRLDEDGVLMANVIAARAGEGSAFYRAMVKTLRTTYPSVYAFPTADTPSLQNIELVASKNASGFTRAQLQRRNDRRDIGLDLSAELRRYRQTDGVDTDDVPVLTDDYAPVDSLLDEQVDKRYVITGYNGSTDRD
ncbi:spermidine synthase [Halapricum sp. CBA1109]|nr:fused MFS/spermidine synthase [Halapricum sp. CBA1109]MUV91004.1 spermidine synthase [Halapricum sp. CBA1109]